MAYFVAVGSSDGKKVDLKFGEVNSFYIYRVDGNNFELYEKRVVADEIENNCGGGDCQSDGCSGHGNGCGGPDGLTKKIEIISDCRCILCAKVGFAAQKQFERKAISVFDIVCDIDDALEKIASYYDKIDNHKSLRG